MAEAMKQAEEAVEGWGNEKVKEERELMQKLFDAASLTSQPPLGAEELEAECSKPQEKQLDAMLKAHQRALEKAR